MSMRDFFRGDRDRDRDRDRWRESWRDENRSGRQEEQQRYTQGRDWGRDEDNEREYGRYGSYAGGMENPQFYGQSGRADWRESDYGRGRDYQSQGRYSERDWGERDYGDRSRGGEQRGYGSGRNYGGGFYTGESERGGQYGGSDFGASQYRGYGGGQQQSGSQYGGGQQGRYGGAQYGSEAGGDLYREREQGGAGGARGLFRGRGPKGYQRSDERIREEVCECLTDDPMIDASNLEVNVKSGEVTLTGAVNSRHEKRRAEEIIEELSGVKDVHNNLRVTSEQSTGTQQGTQQGAQQTTGAQSTQQPRH